MGETPSMDRGMTLPNPEDEDNKRADVNPNREGNEWAETVERYENGEIKRVTKTRDNPTENSTDIETSEYDEKGRLILRELNDDERCESTRNEYDENGRVIEKRNHNERYGDSVMTDFVYDESGEPVSCTVYDLEKGGSGKEAKGTRTTARFDRPSKTWLFVRNKKGVQPNADALI